MRHYIRHPSTVSIQYTLEPSLQFEQEVSQNIGEGGLCFTTRMNIEPGSAIHIQIPISMKTFEANGTVVWCRKSNDHYDVGVKFMDSKTEFTVRMVEQICHIEQYRKDLLEKEGRRLTQEEAAMEWIQKFAKDFPR